MTAPIHARLAARRLLPAEHYVDSGYPSAELLVSSLASFGIALVTPLLADTSPQARAGAGFGRAAFAIDFGTQQATCPQSGQGHDIPAIIRPPRNRQAYDLLLALSHDQCP